MAYTHTTLDSLLDDIAVLLDDPNELYWTRNEKIYAIWEALRVWGGLTSYWRTRGIVPLDPSSPSPFYDLSTALPDLRPRAWTLGQLTAEIQYALLEAANGISGIGMSGQVSIESVLDAITRARNRFVLDSHIPYAITSIPTSPPPDGLVAFAQTSVYVHRVSWQDDFSGKWANLWREDAWAADRSNMGWTGQAGDPASYSESEQSPLKIQLVPPPANSGNLEIVSVDSLAIDQTNAGALLGVPDEWIYAIKYGALSDLLAAESKNKDPLRAQYAQMRYDQAVTLAKGAKSAIRVLLNGQPLNLDSLAALDATSPYWRNQIGPPDTAALLYDVLAISPLPDQDYGLSVDIVQAAPLPQPGPNGFIQIGLEDLPNLIDYVTHVLTFKCGGNEFKATWAQYDDFMTAVQARGGINKAKIRYLQAAFDQSEKEEGERPNKIAGKEAARA